MQDAPPYFDEEGNDRRARFLLVEAHRTWVTRIFSRASASLGNYLKRLVKVHSLPHDSMICIVQ